MRNAVALRLTPFAIGVGIAAGAVAAALVVLGLVALDPPPATEPFYALDQAWFEAVSAGLLIPLAAWLRERLEAAAFALLAAACLLAGWAIEAVRYNLEAPGGHVFLIDLVAGLALVPATTAVIATFASTPQRRLSRQMPVVLGIIIAISVIAVVGQSAIREHGASYYGIGQSLVDWFSSATIALAVLGIAIVGSLRNEAQRFVPTEPVARREATVPRRLGYFVIAALTVSILAAAAGLGLKGAGAAQGQTLLPLLAALVAIIGARWSRYVAWTAVAISLAIGGGVIFAGALDIEVQKFVDDPEAPWSPTASWLLFAGFSQVVSLVGIAAAAGALVESRPNRKDGSGGGSRGQWKLTAAGFGVAAWATTAWLLSRNGLDAPLLEGPFWAISMSTVVLAAMLLLAAGEAARARVVPAIAEAEATSRRPLRPFRYLETVAIEALTARAAVRRSTVAAERSKLASDLHAHILPSLADIRTRYESGAADADVADRLRDLEREVRDLMAERRLVVLEEFGIVEAIEWLIGRAEERASMQIELSVDHRTTDDRPPREVERAAFRIAQLAIENALQHAAPTRLELEVLARSDEVRISVVDDGRGFAMAAARRGRDHVGISDMRSQAETVHGEVQVVSPPTGGTMVTFAWPAA